jgi:gas vesicle protein
MKTKSIVTLIGASAFALAFTSCDSKQEQAREEMLENKAENLEAGADQLRKDGEKVADMKEEHADAIRSGSEKAADATEENADATREAVEKRADEIEDEADKVREAK